MTGIKSLYVGFGWCSFCGKRRSLRSWLEWWFCRRCWESGERMPAPKKPARKGKTA